MRPTAPPAIMSGTMTALFYYFAVVDVDHLLAAVCAALAAITALVTIEVAIETHAKTRPEETT